MAIRPRRRSTAGSVSSDSGRLVALVEPEPSWQDQLTDLMSGFNVLTYGSLEDLSEALAHMDGPLVIVLGPSQADPVILGEARALAEARPQTASVLVVDGATPQVMRMAVRAGLDDAIPMESAPRELAVTVRDHSLRVATEAPGAPSAEAATLPARQGRITTVFSPKGGVGKSVVAVNLAAALAANSSVPVVLVDLNLQFGDVAVMLKMAPNRNILDIGRARHDLDAARVRGLLTSEPQTGLLVLPAPAEPTAASEIDARAVSALFAGLRELGAAVVVDTPPSLNDLVLSVLSDSDDVVFVVDMDLPSVKNARLGLQAFELLELPLDRVLLVLNRANSKVNLGVKDVERTLEMKVDVSLPSDAIVPQSVNTGTPAVLSHGRSRFAGAVLQLADMIRTRAGSRNA